MIARIQGNIVDQEVDRVVVNCTGVGYEVIVCTDEHSKLGLGASCELYIAEQIKEDAYHLFGFLDKSRKQLFQLLVSVNGVGPKAAMAILNVGTEAQVRSAIASGDTKFIVAAKGVGKKVAERAVVDLKSKVGLESSEGATDFLNDALAGDEAIEALIALGHSAVDASHLLRGVDVDLPVQDRVKLALRQGK